MPPFFGFRRHILRVRNLRLHASRNILSFLSAHRACMPRRLLTSVIISIIAIATILHYGVSARDIWVVNVLEALLIIWHWNWPTFKNGLEDAEEEWRNTCNQLRRCITDHPMTIATILNAYFIFRVCAIVAYCNRRCSPWDVKCYSLIFVPSAVIFVVNASFMVLYKREFLKQNCYCKDGGAWHGMSMSV